jgi:hypothetical protein
VEGLNQDREVLQQEVQRVLQLERQREEELSHAVVCNRVGGCTDKLISVAAGWGGA